MVSSISAIPTELHTQIVKYLPPQETEKMAEVFYETEDDGFYVNERCHHIIVEGTVGQPRFCNRILNKGFKRAISLKAFSEATVLPGMDMDKVSIVDLHINTLLDVKILYKMSRHVSIFYPNLKTVNVCSTRFMNELRGKNYSLRARFFSKLEAFLSMMENVNLKMSSSKTRHSRFSREDLITEIFGTYTGSEIKLRNNNYNTLTSFCHLDLDINSLTDNKRNLETLRINPAKGINIDRYVRTCLNVDETKFPSLKTVATVHHCPCTLLSLNFMPSPKVSYCEASVNMLGDAGCMLCLRSNERARQHGNTLLGKVTALTVYRGYKQFESYSSKADFEEQKKLEEIALGRLNSFDFSNVTKLDLSNVGYSLRFRNEESEFFTTVDYSNLEYLAVTLFTIQDYVVFLQNISSFRKIKTLNIECRQEKTLDFELAKGLYPHAARYFKKFLRKVTNEAIKDVALKDCKFQKRLENAVNGLENDSDLKNSVVSFRTVRDLMTNPNGTALMLMGCIVDETTLLDLIEPSDLYDEEKKNIFENTQILDLLWPYFFSEGLYYSLGLLPKLSVVRIKNGIKTLNSPYLYNLVHTHKSLKSIHILDKAKELRRIGGSELKEVPKNRRSFEIGRRLYWPFIGKRYVPIFESTIRDRQLVDIREEYVINVEKSRAAMEGKGIAIKMIELGYQFGDDLKIFSSKEEEEEYMAWRNNGNKPKKNRRPKFMYSFGEMNIDFLKDSEEYWRLLSNKSRC